MATRAVFALLIAGALLPVHASTLVDPIWVRFEAARAEPSKLALRALNGPQGVRRNRPAATLRGLLTAPFGDGPFPAVVLLHDCRGVKDNQRSLAQWLAEQGFMTLVVDSFYSRNAINVCSRHPDDHALQAIGGRVFDAFGALEFLRKDPRVDADRIAVVSWGNRASVSAIARSGASRLVSARFRAAVAISPSCSLEGDALDAPLLIVVAGRDASHRAGRCEEFARRAAETGGSSPVQVLSIPSARYGFDDPSLALDGGFIAAAYDAWQTPRRGLALEYDQGAHRRSIERITDFLTRHLLSTESAAVRFDAYEQAPWVSDPSRPGPDRPPRGRSAFDHLSAYWHETEGEPVPFPIARLVDRLARVAGTDEAGRSGVKATLIPFGRSLQRHAASPEFLRFPRVVMALDGESELEAVASLPRLKDRVFIGYQEKAGVLEIISYNEQAGRFEFQVVEDYRPGATPSVRYANRTLCVSCHHHHAPLFPRAGWDETSQDMQIADRVRRARSDLYGLDEYLRTASAALIDNATDRASELLLWQTLWRDGCGESSEERTACRGALTLAALQYRLSGSNGYDAASPAFRDRVLTPLAKAFESRWPHGLNMASPDLPNREPLKDARPTELSAPQDPLTPRPPLHYRGDQLESIATALVHGVAESLPLALIEQLDRTLMASARPSTRLVLECELTQRGRLESGSEIAAQCANDDGAEIQLRLSAKDSRIVSGQVSALRLPGQQAQQRLALHLRSEHAEANGDRVLALDVRQRTVPLSVRRPDGRRLAGLVLRWPQTDDASRRTPLARFYDVGVELIYAEESAPLRAALERLAEDPRRSPTARDQFDGALLAAAVLEAAGGDRLRVCCSDDRASQLRVASQSEDGAQQQAAIGAPRSDAGVQRFRKACGQCHAADTRMPPGFLHGDDRSARETMTHCAERIFLRLSMWQLDPSVRPKSPMPPASAMGHGGTSDALEPLRTLAADWLSDARGEGTDLAALLRRGYDDASPCLPPTH